ncbi:MAG: deoxynucleoside kinase [Anaerolineaceae bacterium]|nr:deoxynucleoside kinase [Anaerolineaceae bacterium]
MPKRLILLAGNIGAGKTSLTERIGEKLGWATAYESVADNPYLPDFYKSMQDWAFHLQIFYLGHRTEQYLHFMDLPESAILDRSLYEDAHIFARALHHMGNMTDRDYQAYIRLYNLVVKSLPKPDLLIYLDAPVPVLMERIRRRARNIETGISEDYLRLLESFYTDWMSSFDLCPVLTIRSDDLDFVHKSQHLDIVVQRIKDKLAGKEEMVF